MSTSINPAISAAPAAPLTFAQKSSERFWSVVDTATSSTRAKAITITIIATAVLALIALKKYLSTNTPQKTTRTGGPAPATTTDPLVKKHRGSIQDTTKFFHLNDGNRASLQNAGDANSPAKKGGGGKAEIPAASAAVVQYVAPEFNPTILNQRVAKLQTIVRLQLMDNQPGKKVQPFATLFEDYLNGRTDNLPSPQALVAFFVDTKGNITIYDKIIQPFTNYLEKLEDTGSTFNEDYWNACIAEHFQDWEANTSLALGELLYYLHEAKVLDLIHQKKSVPKEEVAKREPISPNAALEAKFNAVTQNNPVLAKAMLPTNFVEFDANKLLSENLTTLVGPTQEETIKLRAQAMTLQKEVQEILQEHEEKEINAQIDAQKTLMKAKADFDKLQLALTHNQVRRTTAIAHCKPQRVLETQSWWGKLVGQ